MASRSNDIWNKTYQEPFHRNVAAIIDPITALRTSGKLDYQSVSGAQSKLDDLIAQFGKDQMLYAGLGKTQAATVANSRSTLDPIIKSWRDSLTNDLSGLKPPEAEKPPEQKPVPDAPPTPEDIFKKPPEAKAREAASFLKKRASGQGRRSTFLGGSLGSPSMAPRKTLMGY